MPSRELRRIKARKGEKTENVVEEKKSRHPFLYIFSVIILVIIVVTFIGGPVIGDIQGTTRIIFGSYAGEPIEFVPGNYFSQQRDLMAEQVRRYGQTEDQDMDLLAYQVWRSAFDQTVVHMAIMRETERAGLWVSDDQVDRALIRSGPYVVDGKFSEDRYRNTPNVERYAIRRLTREQVIQEQFLRDVFEGRLTSGREAEFVTGMGVDERRFNFVSFSFADYPLEEVRSYGQENRDQFRKIKLSRILVREEKEAREIRSKLGERTSSFEELARAHSQDSFAEKGGDMGWRYYYDLSQDFEDAGVVDQILRLNGGEISEALQSRFGWVIYRVDEPVVSLDLQDAEALQTVRDYIMRYERGRVEDHFLTAAESFAATAREDGFLKAATSAGLTAHTTRYFPINYQNFFQLKPVEAEGENASIASAAYSEDFFQQAFALQPGQVSEPISLDDQVLVLQFRDTRTLEDNERDFLKSYFIYSSRRLLEADLQERLIDENLLKDNFNTVFSQKIYNPG